MAFTKNSEKLISYFLNNISLHSKKRTIKKQKQCDKIFKMIHQDIYINDKYVTHLYKKGKIQFEFKEIVNLNQIGYQELFDSNFVDKRCYDYVKNNIVGVFTLSTNISNLNVKINYGIFNKSEFNKLKRLEKLLLHALKIVRFCNLYRKTETVKSLNIFLQLTPILKKLPTKNTDILGPTNCNSAVTFACASSGELLIYREEEWKKTLIHELFHSLCLDFSIINYNKLKDDIGGIFKIKSELLISEGYCEFWASIINCCFCSYSFLKNKNNLDDFILYVEFGIYMERIFSLFQCTKILDFMNLKYEHLWKQDKISESYRNILYKEETNVFSYYILKMILLHSGDDFLIWCNLNNTNTLNFDHSEILFNKFFKFINKNYKAKPLMKNISQMEDKLHEQSKDKVICQTMRMTICDYFIS
jgi:hypothetical protein